MYVTQEDGARPIKSWAKEVEPTAMEQVRKLAQLPFIAKNGVALMPDVHAGIGSTVGSVIATSRVIIPAAVGVDIGCGMNAVRTSLRAADLPDSLGALRSEIESQVPVGAGGSVKSDHEMEVNWVPAMSLLDRARLLPLQIVDIPKVARQLGTLGSGNHFIEVCLDEDQMVWVMLHSGSRGPGNMIGQHYIASAKREAERWWVSLPQRFGLYP